MTREEFENLALGEIDALDRVARVMAGSVPEAEDLVQETYLRALRAFESFELREAGIRPWLLQIMRNLFRDRISASRRQPVSMDGEAMDALPADDVGGMPWDGGNLVADEIREAMGRLPEEYRTVLTLWAVEELSYKDIAQVMNLPIGTIMSRLHRARKRLAEMISDTLPGRKPVEGR